MASLLSNLVNTLAEGIHKIKCETNLFKYKDYDCFLKYTNFKEDLIEYKCLCFNKNNKKSPMKT